MTGRVRLLESHVVDQIAAGEVVERPASVVKELVENALDAGAGTIHLALKDGGRQLVRVTDDGAGMDREDAMMALERHATSKIRAFEDLEDARTLGFRGEALPSIAAVSKFEMVTRPRSEDGGTRIRVDTGKLLDVREVGAAPGTVIEVKALFHALPARKAFLRSAPTEWSHCLEIVHRLALARPDVAFHVRHDERDVLFAESTVDLRVRANAILGEQPWIEVDAAQDGLALTGLVAPAHVQRPAATGASYLYVGGRWVRDLVMRRAIHQAYRDAMPAGRHAVVVLSLQVPAGTVDVNVHPTKSEVRFRDPAGVAAFVTEVVRAAVDAAPRGAVQRARAALDARPAPLPFALTEPAGPLWATPDPAPVRPAPAPAPAPVRPAAPAASPAPVTLVHGRYWVVEEPGGIAVIDAGRLARRVAVLEDDAEPRRLLVPARVSVPGGVVKQVEAQAEALAALGFVVARFSATEVVVRALPASVADVEPAEVLRVALAAPGDVRDAWAEKLPAAPVPDDLAARAEILGIAVGPRVGEVKLA